MHRLTKNKQLNSIMKKLFTLVIAGGMLAFYACGPSKAEMEAKAKATQDSIRMADSIAGAQAAAAAAEKAMADSAAAAQAAIEKAKADSTAAAAAEASAKKGGKKAKEAPKPKAGQGKG